MDAYKARSWSRRAPILASIFMCLPVAAQQGSSTTRSATIEEIVVTATKRGEARLVDVPASITAIGEGQIYRAGMDTFVDYARKVPGLGYQSLSAAGDRDDIRGGRRLNLRGIESGYDGVPTVAYYIDDVPIPVMDPKLFDIERIEVLRGPQGTLYGANSMGGAIRLVMNQPEQNELDFRGDATISTMSKGEESFTVNGMVNVPVIEDRLAIRAVGFYRSLGGYIDNVLDANPAGTEFKNEDINDEESRGARISAEFIPIPGLTITPSIFHQETSIEWGNEYQNDFGDLMVFNKRVPTPENNDFTLYSAEIRWESGNWQLVSATAHFDSHFDSVEDATDFYYQFGIATADQIARNLQEITNDRLTQELRLSYSGERIGGVFGGFWSDEDRFFAQDFPRTYGDLSAPDFFYGTQENSEEQLAVFGEISYDITDTLSITSGARWFRGEQSQDTQFYSGGVLDPKPVFESSASKVSPKLQLSYKPGDNSHFYASASAGFRPGGPNAAIPLTATGCPEALAELGYSEAPSEYEPDELWSYEVGAKLAASDRGSLNLAAYSIEWTDVQQTVFLGAFATEQCGFTFLGNVGKAKSEGVEAEFDFNVTDAFVVSGSLGYTDARFTRSNESIGISSGDRFPLVPELTASATMQYSFPVIGGRYGYLYADASYRDEMLDGLSDRTLDSHTLVNTRFGIQVNDRVELVLFVNNVMDERAQLNLFTIPPPGPLAASLLNHTITSRPRTFGLTIRYGYQDVGGR